MRVKVIFPCLVLCLLFTGCFGVKPEPLSAETQVNEKLDQFTSALEELDYEALKKLLADQLTVDWQTIDKNDIDQILEIFGDYEDIENAILTVLQRTSVDNTVVIDAELYLDLIKNQEKYSEVHKINLILENQGTKWTGDLWLITSILHYNEGQYQYKNAATDPTDLLDRFEQAVKDKAFHELRELLSYTIMTTDGKTINYFRNNQQFIALLNHDLAQITISDLTITDRSQKLVNGSIQVDANLNTTTIVNNETTTRSQNVTITLGEIPEGLVITSLTYIPHFFGLAKVD